MNELEKLRNKALTILPSTKIKLFMDNLYYQYQEEKWEVDTFIGIPKRVKIDFEMLDRPNLMCLITGHIPNYAEKTNKVLDFKHLKELEIL